MEGKKRKIAETKNISTPKLRSHLKEGKYSTTDEESFNFFSH